MQYYRNLWHTRLESRFDTSLLCHRDFKLPACFDTQVKLYPIEMSYVLLGEFDIDEGSILKHQYPEATGADEHLLAELMLPDGAHSRSEDWTIFYLNQTEAVTCKDKAGEGPQGKLLYVLNLVRTKKDDKVRRCGTSLIC